MDEFLIVTHNGRFVVQFELNDIQILQNIGFEVHCATNFEGENMRADARATLENMGVICHQIPIERSPFKFKQNFRAYCELKDIMKQHHFSGVHCHTPMGGVVGRLAAEACRVCPSIYTAHGFHFYKGCPLKNRLIYQTVETFLARYTDAQITINHEDYEAAAKFPLRGKAYFVPGIGIDIKAVANEPCDRGKTRESLKIPANAFVFISVGELNENKNHATAIKAFAKADIPNSYYIICGEGRLKESHTELIEKLGLSNRIRLLGFRKDIRCVLHACDCFVFPSFREGLSVSLMEAMAAGLPCIASRIRGNVDLLKNSRYLFEPADENALCQLLKDAANGVQIEQECELNRETLKKYDIKNVSKEMQGIYSAVIEGTTTNESFTPIKK